MLSGFYTLPVQSYEELYHVNRRMTTVVLACLPHF